MSLTDVLSSKNTRTLSALSMLAEAGAALYRGNKKVALMLAGAAVLAYRFSWVGVAAELAIRLYQKSR